MPRKRRRFTMAAAVTGAFVALSAGSAVVAAPASADPSCPDGNHCAFYGAIGSANKNYFNGDRDFRNDYFTNGLVVDNNVWSASNSSTGNYRSVYWYGYNYSNYLFCVNPGGRVEHTELSDDGVDGNYVGQRDEAGSMSLQSGSSATCFS